MNARSIYRYGAEWPSDRSDLEIEMACVQQGGRWKIGDAQCGEGLFTHYRNCMTLCWPTDDHHRWSDLALREMIQEEIVIFMGCGDSNKTYSMSRFILIDYWCFPSETLWLVSSTEYRGAELRIWGKIKELYNRARRIWPFLTGNVLDSFHAISTDSLDDNKEYARSLQRGLIVVPNKKGNVNVGLSAFVGVKAPRLRHAGDECFPAGTMVGTPLGPRAIETIKPGDVVHSANVVGTVKDTMSRMTESLVTILSKDGRRITCTPNHLFFTQKGWIRACNLSEEHYMIGYEDALQILSLPKGNQWNRFLWNLLQKEMDEKSCCEENVLHCGTSRENQPVKNKTISAEAGFEGTAERENEGQQPYERCVCEGEREPSFDSEGLEAGCEGRKWNRSHEVGTGIDVLVPWRRMESWNQDWEVERERIPSSLQSGLRDTIFEACRRGRRSLPQLSKTESKRLKENRFSKGTWVDRVEVYKSDDSGSGDTGRGQKNYRVFNLEVGGHPSFCVNGLLVHNCQHMTSGFLDAYNNWYGKENFKGIMAGNPLDVTDQLCMAAEPKDGWDNWQDTGKTQDWRSNFFNAKVVSFDGRDSPNFDPPVADKPRYPYLIGKKKLDGVATTHGMDSWQYWNQCIGKPNKGLALWRVITRQMCQQGNAFEPAVWSGKPLTSLYALDPAYGGGDRCVARRIDFGESADGGDILRVGPPELVPISLRLPSEPEEQIARFMKSRMEQLGIPPQNGFYDSFGRGTLGFYFAQVFGSNGPRPVDSGAQPSERPVRYDLFVDETDGTRRLKRCDEHYSKFITEMWFSCAETILSGQMRELDKDTMMEGCARIYKVVLGNRIEVEPKADMKERIGKSPDLFDDLAVGVEGARVLGFKITRIGASVAVKDEDDFFKSEAEEYAKAIKDCLLNHHA